MTVLRQRIEKESLKLFVKKGIHATTIRDISKAADVSEGALYRHYKSKDELAEALFVNHYTGFYDELRNLIAPEKSLAENIDAIVTFFAEQFEKHPMALRYCLLTQHDYIDSVKSLKTPFTVLSEYFEQCIQNGQVTITDPMLCCTVIYGIILQAISFRISKRIKTKLSVDQDALAKAITNALTH